MMTQEKVEEDRFMRHLDEEYLKRARVEKQTEAQKKLFDEMIRPTMVDLHTHLKAKSLQLSTQELQVLARWKLGLLENV